MKTLAMVLSAVLMFASPVFTGAQTTPKAPPMSPGGPAAVQAAGQAEFNWVPLAIAGVVVVAAVVISNNNNNDNAVVPAATPAT